MVHGEVVPEGASTCHLICQLKRAENLVTLFVVSDSHSGITNSRSLNLNRRCKLAEVSNRPGVLEERSKSIHFGKEKEALEGRRGRCRSRRQPGEVPIQDAEGHLRSQCSGATRLSSHLQWQPVGERGFPGGDGGVGRSRGRGRRGGEGGRRGGVVREVSYFHFNQ